MLELRPLVLAVYCRLDIHAVIEPPTPSADSLTSRESKDGVALMEILGYWNPVAGLYIHFREL